MTDNINYSAPEDWGVSPEDEWVSFEELKDNGAPVLEGRDVVGFIEFAQIKLAPNKPPGATSWRSIDNKPVQLDPATKRWKYVKAKPQAEQKNTPAQRMEQARKSGQWQGPVDSDKKPEPKPEQKQAPSEKAPQEKEPTYNTQVPQRTKRGAKEIILNEEQLTKDFPDEQQREKIKKIATLMNSQLDESGNIKRTAGRGGKEDRTLLWEDAEAVAQRNDSIWTDLIESGPPYPQDKVDAFRNQAFIKDVSAQEAEYIYSHLPAVAKNTLKKNGTPTSYYTGLGNTVQEQSSGKNPTDARGVMILHTWLRQGGKDGYSNQPVMLGDAEAEHINPQGGGGEDHPSNLVMIRAGLNRARTDKPLTNLIALSKSYIGDGSDEAKEKLEKLRESRFTGSSARGDAKKLIESVPLDDLLARDWEEATTEYNGMTGGNKGTQYMLRRVNLFNLGNRLRGGKVVMPSTISIPLGRAYWQGNEEERQRIRDSVDSMRENFKNWLNDGKGTPKEYILSAKSALQNAGASDEEMRRAFLDKFFIDLASTNNKWLVKAHGYPETSAKDLKSYYETL